MIKVRILLLVAFMMVYLSPASLRAEGAIEEAGVVTGVTAGNLWFLPIKAISVTMGALSAALSYIVTGGNRELSEQIWHDTTEGPYVITPAVARTAIGDRPELQQTK
jgi:hypothetical protein